MHKIHVLDIPYDYNSFAAKAGARWNKHVRCNIWAGDKRDMPVALTGFEPEPFSWFDYVERKFNKQGPHKWLPTKDIKLRPHQWKALEEIQLAWHTKAPGFLLADDVGLGKTISSWAALLKMFGTQELSVVIVAPLSVLSNWRMTFSWLGTGNLKPLLINYDRMRNLFNEQGSKVPIKHLKGVAQYAPARKFDIFIWDEAHNLKNLQAARTKMALKLYDASRFHLWLSATAGQTPLELGYLLPLLHHRTGTKPVGRTPDAQFESWCKVNDISAKKGAYANWTWDSSSSDCAVMHDTLFKPSTKLRSSRGALRRRPSDIAGWPELQRILCPVTLSVSERGEYKDDWHTVRAKLLALPLPKRKLEINQSIMRLRQKASMLRARHTVDFCKQLVGQGYQVVVSCAYKDTVKAIEEGLLKQRVSTSVLTGETSDRKGVMDAFNSHKTNVIVFTITEGINLHRGHLMGDADDRQRIQIDHDLRWSAIQMHQIDGRAHRDGEHAPVYWSYAEDTYEERVGKRLLERTQGLNELQGDKAVEEDLLAAFMHA
jgi:hypothetical protein